MRADTPSLNPLWINASRTLACALVVLVHVNIFVRAELETWWPFGMVSAPVFGAAVPTFFILSGYSTRWVNGSSNSAWIKRKLQQVLLPFLFWNTVMLLMHSEGPEEGIDAVLYWLTGYWHLYFLFVLMQLLIVGLLFDRYLGPRWPAWMLVAGVATTVSAYVWSDVLLWTEPPDGGWIEVLTRRVFLLWFLFYAVGAWLRYNAVAMQFLSRRLSCLAVIAAACYLGYMGGLFAETYWIGATPRLQFLGAGLPFQVAGPVLLLALLYRLQDQPRFRGVMRMLAASSRFTYGIYLSHLPILIALVAAVQFLNIPIDHWIAVPVFAISIWLVARLAVDLCARHRLWMIMLLAFGVTARRRA